MTDQEQQVAIAEACGWARMEFGLNPGASGKSLFFVGSSLHGTPPRDKYKPEDEQAFERVPDYLSDLNAMHEAEKILIGEREYTYYSMLLRVVFASTIKPKTADLALINATARQRAEAFLRTIGKWRDS